MADIPEGAQRSPDGFYWWDENAQAWQPVHDGGSAATQPAAASTPTASSTATAASTTTEPAAGQPTSRTGTITVEPGVVHEQAVAHDEVVAMVQRGGAELPEHEGAGEAYA